MIGSMTDPDRAFARTVFLRPLVIVMIAVFFLCSCATIHLGPEIGPFEEKKLSGKGPGKILLIDISGAIGNHSQRSLTGFPLSLGMVETVREVLKQAEEDDDIKALLVRINSPGGTVTSSDIIYHELKVFKERKKIKVYVAVVDLAASGGYYVAQAGDYIFAHPTSLIGSIGVIALKLDLHVLMGNVGVDWEVIKSAEKKDFLSPFRPLTEEERKLFQETIDQFHERFVNIISTNRPNLNLESTRSLADGRVFTADQALKAKLIDGVGYFDDLTEKMKSDLNDPNLEIVTYQRPGEYKTNLYSSLQKMDAYKLIDLNFGMDFSDISPKFLYMWMP
jgi:protease IV